MGRKTLTGRRLEALELLARGLSTTEVAARLGVNPRTVRKWRADPAFAEALEEATKETLRRTRQRLAALAHHACEALHGVLRSTDAPPSVKVSSARAVLEYLAKFETLARLEELEARVRALEERLGHDRTS